jgi:hypothetical protein
MSAARILLLAGLAACAACTPVRSKLPPPYLIDGEKLSAAQLDDYAIEACARNSNGTAPPPNKFTTDGCSAYRDNGWRECCVKHDVAYWCGAVVRRDADAAFRQCVRAASSSGNAGFMYSGVRLGGGRFMPFPWRFGYGHPWPHRKPAAPEVTSSEPSPKTPLTNP